MHLNHVFTCPYRLWGSLIGGAAINMNGSSFQGYPSDAEGIHKFRLIMSINRIGGPSLTVHTSHGDHHFVVKDHTVVAQLLYSAYSHSNQVHSTCIEERKDVFAVFSSICNFTFNLNTSALVFPVHVQLFSICRYMYAVIADRVGVSRALGCKLHCHDHVQWDIIMHLMYNDVHCYRHWSVLLLVVPFTHTRSMSRNLHLNSFS